MRIACAWCNRNMGEKDSKGVRGVSHGLCREYFDNVASEVENGIMRSLVIAEDTQVLKANAKKAGSQVKSLWHKREV